MNLLSPADVRWQQRALSVLRIVVAFLFVWHGTQKLFGYPPGPQPFAGAPPILTQVWFAGVLETFGGALLVLGLLTRPAAFLLAGEMAVAYFQVHFPRGFLPIVNRGESPVLFCFVFLYLAFAGGGAWSVDAALAKRIEVDVGRR